MKNLFSCCFKIFLVYFSLFYPLDHLNILHSILSLNSLKNLNNFCSLKIKSPYLIIWHYLKFFLFLTLCLRVRARARTFESSITPLILKIELCGFFLCLQNSNWYNVYNWSKIKISKSTALQSIESCRPKRVTLEKLKWIFRV